MIKTFTKLTTKLNLHLNARWFVFFFMLAVSINAAWAQDMYVAGTMTNWATGQVKLSTASSTYSGYYYATFTVEAGTHEYKIKESGDNWWCSTYNTTNSSGVTYTSRSNNCNNIQIKTTSAGTLEIYHNKSNDNTFAKFYIPCTTPSAPSITINDGSSAKLCSGTATITTTVVAEATEYKLYKDDSSTASQTNETGTFTVSEAGIYYVTVTTCDESDKSTGVTLEYYSAPTLTYVYAVNNSTKCGNTSNNDGSIEITNIESGVTYSLNDETGTSWNNLADDTYTLKATLNACSNLYSTKEIEISEVNNTPAATVTISGEDYFCEGGETILTCNVTGLTGDITGYQWYNGENAISDATSETYTVTATGTYKVVATVNNNGCVDTFEATEAVDVTMKSKPDAPTFSPSFMAVCSGETFSLPVPTNAEANNVTWTVNSKTTVASNLSITEATTYTAVVNDGCLSDATDFEVTVNPLPIISISGSEEAVLYEDVTLTATATDAKTINWSITDGTGTLSNTTGTSVKLTSSTAGTVKVKATATSEYGCTKESNELSVIFANETCNNVADMTKIYFDATENTGFVTGSNVYVTITKSTNGSADCNDTGGANQGNYAPKNDTWWGTMTKVAGENYIYEITIPNDVTINKGTTKLSFWNNKIDNYSDVYNVQAILGQKTSSGTNCMKLSNKSKTHNDDRSSDFYCGTWVTYANKPQISAPAAKIISVSTTDGEGNIIFSGQVVKTGCDATNEYGFQYSSDEQTWTTVKVGENAAAGTAISNNTVNGLDGTYYVRAYITNDNSTQYGAIKEITVSTKKYPITIVTLTHVKNQAGDPYSDQELEDLTYCAGETVWFKLEQDGSKFQDYQWISYPGTDLVGMYAAGTFSFTITDSGNVGIRLKNDENDDWVESNLLEFNTHPVAISPTISFENATICSNSTATLKLGALVVGQSYELYKEIENEGVYSEERVGNVTLTCNSIEDDLEFTGLNESGKYFVKGYTAQCPDYKASSQTATLEIVDASSVYITLDPTSATTTPWMPVKFTVAASDDYTLEVPEGVEFSQNGDICSVKIPLPQGATGGEGQYENVSFPQDATTSYTVTAKLVSTGGEDNPCATPASATITLTPYVEECTIGH